MRNQAFGQRREKLEGKALFCCHLITAVTVLLAISTAIAGQPEAITVSPAKADARGCLVHAVTSPFQSGETSIRVLLPDRLDPARRYPVVYVLPVEKGDETKYGDGLVEVQKRGLHNRYSAIFVAPTFSHLPWYADHPEDLGIRQESYLIDVVLPFVEKAYPVRTERSGRLLVGFSKSGWGAWCMLLRHPTLFERAAAWDAPMMMDWPCKYGSAPIFANADNFQKYQVTRLLKQHSEDLRKEPRLILLGFGNFHDQHRQCHALTESLKISHVYLDGPERKHIWESGWLPEAVELLMTPDLSPKAAPATRPS